MFNPILKLNLKYMFQALPANNIFTKRWNLLCPQLYLTIPTFGKALRSVLSEERGGMLFN